MTEAPLNDSLTIEVPGYRLERVLGRGGFGVVLLATGRDGRRVALKVLPFVASLDSRRLQRFKNEAHAAACLHHTNIVPVYGTGCERSNLRNDGFAFSAAKVTSLAKARASC